jgi:AI-2 transport protein TqsA
MTVARGPETTAAATQGALPVPRGLLIVLGLAAATIAVGGIREISGLLAPIFLALVLVVAVHPVRGWIERLGLPGWIGTVASIVAVYLILLGLTLSLVVAGARFAALLPGYQDEFTGVVSDTRAGLAELGVDEEQLQSIFSGFDLGRLSGVVTSILSSMVDVLSNLFLIVTLLLFLCMDAAWFPARLDAVRGERGQVAEAFESFARGTRRYLVVSTIFGLIVAVLDAIALWLLGVPAPVLWGLLAFITNYIPNIGFVIGLVPPAALALLEGGPGLMLAVIAVYCVLNVLIQTIIQPRFVGDAVGLSTSLTFLSLVFWAWTLGALGALLAIPLSLLAKALLVDVDPYARWLSPLISNKDSP